MEVGSLHVEIIHTAAKPSKLLIQGPIIGVDEPISLSQCQTWINFFAREMARWPIAVPK
jgi:hypothetical protein